MERVEEGVVQERGKRLKLVLVEPGGLGEYKAWLEEKVYGLKKYRGPTLFYSWVNVEIFLKIGRFQLWVAVDEKEAPVMAMLTETEVFPKLSVLRICFIIGKGVREALRQLLPEVERIARKNKVDAIMCDTFPKFSAVLARYGFRPHAITLFKSVATLQ